MDTSSDVLSKIAQFKSDTRDLKDHINTWLSSFQLISNDIDAFKDFAHEKGKIIQKADRLILEIEKREQKVKENEIKEADLILQKQKLDEERDKIDREKIMLREKKVILDKKEELLREKSKRVQSIMSSLDE